jgi:hypothetical protein
MAESAWDAAGIADKKRGGNYERYGYRHKQNVFP